MALGGPSDFSGLSEDGGLEQTSSSEKLLHQLDMRFTAFKVSVYEAYDVDRCRFKNVW